MAEKQMDELMKIFPVGLREILSQVVWYREDLEEIRIRIQRPVQFVTSQASFYLDPREKCLMTQAKGGLALGEEDLREMLTYVCEYSRYAYARQMRQGFLALDGGIRLGLCGQYMAEEDGRIGMEYPMYFSIRIPHEKKGCAAWIEPWLIEGEAFLHTLILAAPGMGKTTFLRDLVRVLSDRPTCRGLALIDERYELAAANLGIPQNDVGLHTDAGDPHHGTADLGGGRDRWEKGSGKSGLCHALWGGRSCNYACRKPFGVSAEKRGGTVVGKMPFQAPALDR